MLPILSLACLFSFYTIPVDLMKSWAGIEEEKAGRSVCCVMQSVRVLVMCCGIVLHTSYRLI